MRATYSFLTDTQEHGDHQEDTRTYVCTVPQLPHSFRSFPPSLLPLPLTNGYQGRVQEEEDTHGDEEEAQAQQTHANLLVVVQHGSMLLLLVVVEELCVLAYPVYVLCALACGSLVALLG